MSLHSVYRPNSANAEPLRDKGIAVAWSDVSNEAAARQERPLRLICAAPRQWPFTQFIVLATPNQQADL
jgi:hypothetical protein